MEESASTETVGTSITTSSTVSPETSDPSEDDLDVSHYAIVFSQVLVWVFCNLYSHSEELLCLVLFVLSLISKLITEDHFP